MTKPTTIKAPVVEVTLLEDRARVVRRGTVTLPAGAHRVCIEDVAPVLVDKSLSAKVLGDGAGARALHTHVVRKEVFDEIGDHDAITDGSREALVLERQQLDDLLGDITANIKQIEARLASLDHMAKLTYAELSDDASFDRAPKDDVLVKAREEERSLGRRLVDLGRELEKKTLQQVRLDERIENLTTASTHEAASLEVELSAASDTECVLEVSYLVPGACWRPYHTARLAGGASPSVHFATDACIWQNTGEDWNDVRLVLSTERPSLGASPPPLQSDKLRVQKRSEVLRVETREQTIETTGVEGAPAHEVEGVPGVDDGGDVQTIRPSSTASIPSDGRPYRIPIGEFDSAATVELVAVPELSTAAFLVTKQSHAGNAPILAGPVDLVRDSGLVGRTSVLFISVCDRFELGWGPDPSLRASRQLRTSDQKNKLLSSWIVQKRVITIRLSNLGADARTLVVKERVPVSEIDEVKIEIDEGAVTDNKKPDSDGFLTWTVDIEAYGHASLTSAYSLKKHEDVVGV